MADKLVAVRIKQQDNTYSNEIPIGAWAENVAYDNTKNLLQVLGTIDMYKGDVQTQLNALFEDFNGIAEDVAGAIDDWVTEHMPSWDPEEHLDDTLTADNLAPVSSAVPKLIAVNEAEIQGTKMKISTAGQEDLTILTPNDIDNTLSQQGEAADAKATGEMIMINNAATTGTKIRLETTEEDIDFTVKEDADNLAKSLANEYDPTKIYKIGEYCIYDYKLYQCKSSFINAQETFDENYWNFIPIAKIITNKMDYIPLSMNGKTIEFYSYILNGISNARISIPLIQEGNGESSPDNIRKILAYDEAIISVIDEHESIQETYNISFSLAGKVCEGLLDITNGTLTINKMLLEFDGSETWSRTGTSPYFIYVLGTLGYAVDNSQICSHFANVSITSSNTDIGVQVRNLAAANQCRLFIRTDGEEMASTTAFKQWLADQKTNGTPLQVAFELTNPIIYTLIPTEIENIIGYNKITNNCGNLYITYKADAQNYINTMLDYVSPEMFGAVGDGITDDSNAIQNAINNANGKPVVFMSSNYLIENQIVLTNNTKIFGQGAIVTIKAGTVINGAAFYGNNKTDIYIEGIKVNVNGPTLEVPTSRDDYNRRNRAFAFNVCTNVEVCKCRIDNLYTSAISFSNLYGSCSIHDCYFTAPNSKKQGYTGEFISISNFGSINMNNGAVDIKNNYFKGNISSDDNGTTALYGTCAIVVTNFYGKLTIDGNLINDCGRAHTLEQDHRLFAIDFYVNVHNATVSNNIIRSTCGFIRLKGCENCVVENNYVYYKKLNSPHLFGDPYLWISGLDDSTGPSTVERASKNIRVVNNTIRDDTGTYERFILIHNATSIGNEHIENIIIDGNTIISTKGDCFIIDTSVRNCKIINNHIEAVGNYINVTAINGISRDVAFVSENIEIAGNTMIGSSSNGITINPDVLNQGRTLKSMVIHDNRIEGNNENYYAIKIYNGEILLRDNFMKVCASVYGGNACLINNIWDNDVMPESGYYYINGQVTALNNIKFNGTQINPNQ